VKFVSLKWISRENRQQGGKWLQGKDKRLVSVPLDDPNTDQLLDEHPDPESALITSERRRHLYTALAQLSPEVRAAWIAVNLEGKDKAAVATLARCSRTTIYGRIREADDFILTKLQVCALEGTVRDSQSKKRLAATVVATSVDDARGYSETTDHRSPFRFSGLSVGEYMLSGRAPSYQVSNEKVEIHLGLNFRDISLVRATSAPAGTEC
jgi:hypothetical protein